MQGLYNATGDISLLLKMGSLFKPTTEVSYEAPAGQRPAGPIPLPGMAWMPVTFLPWMIHWITFDIPGVSRWISVGLPLLLSALIVGYWLAFGRGNHTLFPRYAGERGPGGLATAGEKPGFFGKNPVSGPASSRCLPLFSSSGGARYLCPHPRPIPLPSPPTPTLWPYHSRGQHQRTQRHHRRGLYRARPDALHPLGRLVRLVDGGGAGCARHRSDD